MASKALPVISQETYANFNACIHCGLCLPACPTYVETLDEADSPRGRIHLMKAVVDGKLEGSGEGREGEGISDIVFEHLDRCLVCRACETACPSGVVYHELIEAVRPQVAEAVLGRGRHLRSGSLQWVIARVLPFSRRAAAAIAPLKWAQRLGLAGLTKAATGLLSRPLASMAAYAPPPEGRDGKRAADISGHTSAASQTGGISGTKSRKVVLLRGCVGSVVSGPVNRACVQVLALNGFDVRVLENEPCCGAMAAHANDPRGARVFAMQLIDALLADGEAGGKAGGGADYFVSPIAGCGAQVKSYAHLLADNAQYAPRAREVARKMRDITELLAEAGIRAPCGRIARTVTYHDPCHLVHAQRISDVPRRLLGMIPGLMVVPLVESDMCCGAAGTYSFNQPEMSQRLGRRKAEHVRATGATEVVTANVGCTLQIARALHDSGSPMPVRHVVELLAESYAAERTSAPAQR